MATTADPAESGMPLGPKLVLAAQGKKSVATIGNLNARDTSIAKFSYQQSKDVTVTFPSLEPSYLISQTAAPPEYPTVQLQEVMWSPSLSIPPVLSHTPRSLIQRPTMRTGAERIRSLIFHTMKSYPLMILHNDSVLPYVHAHLASSDDEDDGMEPLNNCISLVHMLSHGVRGSSKLFWKNVRQECDRLCATHMNMNKCELLAAMQALSIYIIMRLDQGETDNNNVDFLMTATVTALAKRFNEVLTLEKREFSGSSRDLTWKSWILQESGRRICVVYQVLNLLVYFEPAALCDKEGGFMLAPLPAQQDLWEASDEFAWRVASRGDYEFGPQFGLTMKGDLVKLDKKSSAYRETLLIDKSMEAGLQSASVAPWEEWCSGMDRFGGLVMLAASLMST
ncbi:hypothetical protein BKA67DRAFT_4200 [Truncatella angustata]|uniref:Transcription factor domain-containing protein n=1 Tax=Truncatella angustata TaxID=152316 RepID=A0A9P9A3K9_9PEZI|nr:uncharacterized protein BKA67DRAFT_4200 [Truncatella angustata]KAH6659029.1 hypothetical protein BKA67DRAFT_4200 [Truncatella angustata]